MGANSSAIKQKLQKRFICGASFEKRDFKSKYTLGSTLGKGTFGKIFEATQRRSFKTVAVKFIKKKNVESLSEIDGQMIPSECVFLNHLDHPNIISLIDLYEFKSKFAVVLERPLASMDLSKFVSQFGPQSDNIASYVASQLLAVCSYMQESSIFHRDLKSENILIDAFTYQINIIDFGSSAWIQKDDDTFLGDYGTPAFSPPEWINGQAYYPESCTIWNIGVILYELIIGCLPFTSEKDVKKCHLNFPDHVSNVAKDFIKKLLQHDLCLRPTYTEARNHIFLDMDLPEFGERLLDSSTYSKCSAYTHYTNHAADGLPMSLI